MNTNKTCQGLRSWAGSALVGLTLSLGSSGAMAQVNAAQLPLFLSSSADPNIMFVLDDSGSMHWEITPDDVRDAEYVFPRAAGNYGGSDYNNNSLSFRDEATTGAVERGRVAALRSFHVNKSYYNPAVTYRPWAKPAGMAFAGATPAVDTAASHFPEASPVAAPHHPLRDTGTRNLTVDNTQTANWCANGCSGNASRTFYPAVYFHYIGGGNFDRASYEKVEIRSTTLTYSGHGRENRSECTAGTCTYEQEIQNFANWYTYFRSRMLAAQAGIGRAFVTQPETMRVGFGAINKASTPIDTVNTRTVIRGVRPFSGADRNEFFDELYGGIWPTSNTPLRRALDDVGQYYSRADNRGPWGAIPGTDNTTNHLTCRQSFAILMTDGYWTNNTDSQASTAGARANVDGTAGTAITAAGPPAQTYTYAPATPFTDAHANTLADVAMYYWNRDLRPTLENRVPSSNFNPAFWQHMVTYGVGFGVSGTIDASTALGAINADPAVNITWPNPTGSNAARIDDLLHAAVNSRGGFFSAADPDTFATELSSVLTSIVARVTAAGTSAATSAAVLQTDTLLYNASFRSTDWSGTLVARRLNSDGSPNLSPTGLAWDAEQVLATRAPATRDIFTSTEAGAAVPFDFASISLTQRNALGENPAGAPASTATAQDRIDWLYGTDNAQLRPRLVDGITRRIGDLIGSNPQFMARRDFGYRALPGAQGSSYNAFRNSAAYTGRPETLFVGSNGGMFHAFNATNGTELFSYIPSELLLPGASGTHAQINDLMRTDYSHRFYVDGSAEVSDAYINGAWRTVAIGTMGAGGRTVFALDVTNPASFSQANVLWEFKHAASACVAEPTGASGSRACRDIGFGVTKPKIVRLASGRWAAVFGNGYNSFDHRARLMVVDLQTGRLLYNLLTPDDTAEAGSASAGNPNGLSPPETTDWPANNLNLSNAYAGDLLGNMWRFNFVATPPTVARVFSAVDGATPALRQPITATPLLALKPGQVSEVVVLFGTGSFFKVGDDNLVAPQVQTFYGIFDTATPSAVAPPVRSDLLAQSITSNASALTIGTETYAAGSLRFLTQNTLTNQPGWRVDLPAPGERVISNAIFPTGAVQERVRFATLIPDDDPCGSGRQGFLMDMSVLSGGRSVTPAFDVNGDGAIDTSDATGGLFPSGIGGPTGEMPINIRSPNSNVDNIYGGDGSLITRGSNTSGPVGRQSWRQLR